MNNNPCSSAQPVVKRTCVLNARVCLRLINFLAALRLDVKQDEQDKYDYLCQLKLMVNKKLIDVCTFRRRFRRTEVPYENIQ